MQFIYEKRHLSRILFTFVLIKCDEICVSVHKSKGLYAIKKREKESEAMQEMDDGVLLVAVTKA